MNKKNIFSCIIIASVILFNCTHNPFFDDKGNTSDTRSIWGVVHLNDSADPDSIFIWLEGLNISTYTGVDGRFKLEIPTHISQSLRGTTNTYRIYYYVANYLLETSEVIVKNGNFQYGGGDIDNSGNIRNAITLEKLIDIQTEVIPSTITRFDSTTRLEIKVTLMNQASNVQVQTLKGPSGDLVGFLFKKAGDPLSSAIINASSQPHTIENINKLTVWKGGIMAFWLGLSAEPAAYDVFPYLQILQSNLPLALIQAIDEHANTYHYAYLKIPMRQTIGHLRCVENK